MSALFPDRPIRPLPKRKLRERLSPDVAGSIEYPPAPPIATPLFYYPYNLSGEEDRPRGEQYQIDRQRVEDIERNYIPKNKVDDIESEEEVPEIGPNRGRHVRHSPDPKGKAYRYVQKATVTSQYPVSEAPMSAASSVDGYDSFENTNNKKKRKIPTPGDAGLNGIHLSNELASLGISQEEEVQSRGDFVDPNTQLYGSPGAVQTGLSGPGRGRYGRTRNGRSPLRTLPDANIRSPKQRQQWPTRMSDTSANVIITDNFEEPTGIISAAIANAEKLPVTPSRGQENVSLLQQASQKASPASTQFTFTCDSQVPGTIPWPGPPSIERPNMAARNIMNTRATQTTPTDPLPGPPRQQHADAQGNPKANRKQRTPKQRRQRAEKELLIAARQRREQQEYQNYHNPPNPKDEWICEFCEYERIFGTPPVALIRSYERKDRLARKQEAERRRLLEKAKTKGRKGKKGSKNTAKSVPAQQHAQQPSSAERAYEQGHPHSTQSEDYYEDEYDDEYTHEGNSQVTGQPAARRPEDESVNSRSRPIPYQSESAHPEVS